MALSIFLKKITEDTNWACYEYGSTGKKFGKLKINKRNGDVDLIEEAEDDLSGVQARAASLALIRHWKKNEYPEQTYWAS